MFALVLLAYSAVEVVTMVSAISAAVIGIITAWRSGQIKKEVTTINGRSLAQLGDATETRRIERLPLSLVTAEDEEHLHAAPDHNDVPSVDPAKN